MTILLSGGSNPDQRNEYGRTGPDAPEAAGHTRNPLRMVHSLYILYSYCIQARGMGDNLTPFFSEM